MTGSRQPAGYFTLQNTTEFPSHLITFWSWFVTQRKYSCRGDQRQESAVSKQPKKSKQTPALFKRVSYAKPGQAGKPGYSVKTTSLR